MATVNYYLDVAHPKQDGTCSLKFLFRNRGTSAALSTGHCLPPECWDGSKVITARGKQLPVKPSILNNELSAQLAKVTLAVRDITGKKSHMSAAAIKAKIVKFLNGAPVATNTDHDTLVGIYEEYLTGIQKDRQRITISSPLRYIQKNYSRANNILIDDIDGEWAGKLQDMMLSGTRVSRALRHNTVSSYMGILSGVWNWARKNGYISHEVLSPFAEQRRPYQPTASRALTIEEVRKLWSCEPKNIYQAVALDMFKLSFMLCGLNPADMFLLTDAETKGHRINTQRQKTGVSINILIMPEAQEILDRYKLGKWMLGQILSAKDKARGETYLTNCKVNKALDQIMPGLTMYYARHTWMSLGAELDIPDRVLFMGIAHKMGKYSDETYITMRHRKLDLANRRILDYVLQQGEFEPDPDPLDNM